MAVIFMVVLLGALGGMYMVSMCQLVTSYVVNMYQSYCGTHHVCRAAVLDPLGGRSLFSFWSLKVALLRRLFILFITNTHHAAL